MRKTKWTRITAACLALLQTGIAGAVEPAMNLASLVTRPSVQTTVFFIYDVHANPEAQSSISRLVESLRRKSPVAFIGLEGAFDAISVDRLRGWRDRDAAKSVADFLLREKQISGPIQAAIAADAALPPLVGIDEASLYTRNVEAYRRAHPKAADQSALLDGADRAMAERLAKGLSPATARLHAAIESRRSGVAALDDHLKVLEKAGVALTPNIRAYAILREAERTADPDRIKIEQARLTASLTKRLSPRQHADIRRLASDAAQGDLSAFHRRLKSLCETAGVAISDYPAIEAQARAADAAEQLDIDNLETDLETLDAEAVSRIASPAEKALLDEARFLTLSRKLISFSLTRNEWETYGILKATRDTPLTQAPLFEEFYVTASLRDHAISERTLALVRERKSGGIIVAGGFHSTGVARRLREEGIRVKPVYPTFAIDEITSGSDYLRQFDAPSSPIEPLLMARADSLAPNPVQGLPLAPYLGAALNEAASPARSASAQADFDAVNGPSDIRVRTSDTGPGAANARFTSPNATVELDIVTEKDPSSKAPRIVRATFRETVSDVSARLIASARSAVSTVRDGVTQTVLTLGNTVSASQVRAVGRTVPLLLMVALAGCVTNTDRIDRTISSPQAYVQPFDAQGASIDGWIRAMGDSRLEALVNEAMRNNTDLKVAAARYEAAQAMHVKARSDLFPSLTGGARASETRLYDLNKRDPEVFVSPPPYEVVNDRNLDPGSDRSSRSRQFVPSLGLSWELDVWGRVRSGKRASAADAAALDAAYRYARQSVAGQVARNYVVLIEAHMQVRQTEAMIERLTKLHEIAKAREEWNGKPADTLTVASQLKIQKSELSRYQAAEAKAARGLEVLLNRYPAAEIQAADRMPPAPSSIRAGIPSELLERRFDIVSARFETDAEFQRRKQAAAARLPRFSIDVTGNATVGSGGILDVGYTAGANILAPILDWGSRLADQRAATANEKAAVANYVSVVTHAFEEVETALNNTTSLEQREQALAESVDDARRAADIEMERATANLSTIEAALQAQLRYMPVQTALISVRSLRVQNRIDLHLALGGDFAGDGTGRAPAITPAPSTRPSGTNQPPVNSTADNFIPMPTGGAWFSNPAYLRYAWLETPVVYGIAALVYLGVALWAPQVALLPAVVGSVLGTAPALFVAGHRLGNPAATFSRPVMALAAAKAATAVLAAAAVAFAPTIGIAALVPVAGAAAITFWHYQIQRNVLLARASAQSKFAAQSILALSAQGTDAAATAAAAAVNAAAGSNVVTPVAMAYAGRSIAAEGSRPSAAAVQAALQGAVADSLPATPALPAAGEGLPQNQLSLIILDRGAGPAMTDHALQRAADDAERGREVVIVADSEETLRIAQAAPANARIRITLAAEAFDEISGLGLAMLNDHLGRNGYLNGNPAVNLLARADLPIQSDGLDPASALARALILLLNRDLQAVAVTVGGLSNIAEVARIVAQQA